MAETAAAARLADLWDDAKAASMTEPERLVYRSNLLGSDKRVTNYGGGNTSSKIFEKDPLTGQAVEVLWVKGSGGDLGSMKLDGFSTLYMDKLRALKGLYRGLAHEDEMVGYLPHATFNLNPRAASIDTPLHAFVPHAFVDHMHPDAIIAIAASQDGEALTKEIFGDEIGWLPWKRPGFELGLWLEKFCLEHPNAKGVILGSHGLFTWGDTPKECYETTIAIINQAMAWLEQRTAGKSIFGGAAVQSLPAEQRRAIAAKLMPKIRGLISADSHKLGHFDDSAAVLEFANSKNLRPLAALGTSCPDHFLRTKIRPLVIDFDPAKPDVDAVIASIEPSIAAYRVDYEAYYNRSKHPDSPALRDPNAVVYLMPGVGMFTFAKDKATARISGEFYVNAINVMRGSSTVSTYQGLPEQEAFDIEYWLLEEAKLQRMPKPKSLAGHIALVTGGAGGIGKATAIRLLREGACVVLADIDEPALAAAQDELGKAFGKDFVRGVKVDVTKEEAGDRWFCRLRRRVRRHRHPREQRRHRLRGAARGHDAGALEQEHGYPCDRLLPRQPRSLPPVPQSENRRQCRLRRQQERPRRLAQRRRLLHRQGRRNPPRPLPRARRGRRTDPRQRGQPRRGAARLENLDRRVEANSAPPPTRCPPTTSRNTTASARC